MRAKRIGDVGEIAFLLRATQKGFVVSRPWTENCHYDFVLDQNGRLVRVQVKATGTPKKGRDGGYAINVTRGSTYRGKKTQFYEFTDVDYFAIYIVPTDTFYLIPSHTCCDRGSVYVFPERDNDKWIYYRERWEF